MAFGSGTWWEIRTTGADDFVILSVAIAAGGSSYQVNDPLTASGGTSTTTATFTVTSVDGGGAVTGITVANSGHYTVTPSNAVSTTGGHGTGCTLNLTWNTGGMGGAFDTGNTNFATDGSASSANTASPVFSSLSYSFVAGDVGAWIFIKSGTNWTPGFYQIASVSGGNATLTAGIGTAVLVANTNYSAGTNTAAGCATVSSTGGNNATWSVDYSQSNSARVAFTDLVIDAATNTKLTSAANPFGPNHVGNAICITGGSGFTLQRVQINSVTGTAATVNVSAGTLGSTGGTGNLGGALASYGLLGPASGSNLASKNSIWVKTGTYTIQSVTAGQPDSIWALGTDMCMQGYNAMRGDDGTPPTFKAASGLATSNKLFSNGGTCPTLRNLIFDGNNVTGIMAINAGSLMADLITVQNFKPSGFSGAVTYGGIMCRSVATNIQNSAGFAINSSGYAFDCVAYNCSVTGFILSQTCIAVNCISYNNSGANSYGFSLASQKSAAINCVAYGNGGDGFRFTTGVFSFACINCISEGNGGYGYGGNSGAFVFLTNCASYNNGSTLSGGASSTYDYDKTNVTGPKPSFQSGTASFFLNGANGNFGLSAAGLTLCRAAGIPGAYPGGIGTTGYLDIGAVQHPDAPINGFLGTRLIAPQ